MNIEIKIKTEEKMSEFGNCTMSKQFYYIDTSIYWRILHCKIHTKPHPGLRGCIFHILSSEDINDFTPINLSVSLKLY